MRSLSRPGAAGASRPTSRLGGGHAALRVQATSSPRSSRISSSSPATQRPIGGGGAATRAIAPLPRSLRGARAAAQEAAVLAPPSPPSLEFLGLLDGMLTVKGRLELPAAPPGRVFGLLLDYDSCARVFSNIASTQTHVDDAGGKQVVQACKWSFLAFGGTFNVRLAVTEEAAQRLLVFRLVESSFMRDFEGRWQVLPREGGGCVVEHVLAVKPLVDVPPAVAPYTSHIFKQQVAGLLRDLADEVERLAGEPGGTAAEASRSAAN